MRVVFFNRMYVADRLLINLPFRNVTLEHKRDLFNVLTFAQRKLFRPASARQVLNCLHHDLPLTGRHVLHLINSISLSSTPWVVTYEHWLPRWDQNSRAGWKRLASPSCRKLMAISHWAQQYQEGLLEEFPEFSEAIRPKLCVIPPAQEALIADYDEKILDPDWITFTLVGSDFFRKGGKETLEAFTQLVKEKLPIHLNIVSSLDFADYASQATEEDHRQARALIAGLGDHVTHYASLNNTQVLDLFKRTHVGLLPTYHDTYGFSVLEAQGAACPVISTDSNALPEFNDDTVGWMIPVPKDGHGMVRLASPAEREQLSQSIRDGLLRSIRQICDEPSLIRSKGAGALHRIRRDFNPADRVRQLEDIYRQALFPG